MSFTLIIKTLFEITLIGAFAFSFVYFVITFFALVHTQLKPRPKKRKSLINPPSITVQIPTYNEIAALNCAERCLNFEYPKEHLQIIIGDDSDDPLISKRIDKFASLNSQIEISRRGTNNGYKPGNLNAMLTKSVSYTHLTLPTTVIV